MTVCPTPTPRPASLSALDPAFLHTWWQLHDGGNLEHALGGWWNIPILDVEDQDAFIQAKVLDLIRNLRETPEAYRSRF